MKLLNTLLSVASLASAAVISAREDKVSYDGFKVFRINATDGIDDLRTKVATLSKTLALHGHADHLDVAVAPSEAEAFDAFGFAAEILDEDLGASIAAEGPLVSYEGSWLLLLGPH